VSDTAGAPGAGAAVRPETVYRRLSSVRFRTVLDEGVVIQQDNAEVMVLSEVGARVLELLDGVRTVAAVEAALVHEFEAPAGEVGRDLASYLGELLAARVIEEAPG
jgi:hypothetical protein